MMDAVERERWVVTEPGAVGPTILVALESGYGTELDEEDPSDDSIGILEAELVGGTPCEDAVELPEAELV